MCGIVGLYTKNPELESMLGAMLSAMLLEMTERGPDSAGFAIYRNHPKRSANAAEDVIKMTLQGDMTTDWDEVYALIKGFDPHVTLTPCATHAIVNSQCNSDDLVRWVDEYCPNINITSIGNSIEIYKEKGLPTEVINTFSLDSMSGTHALGHTRMATESAVTREHSHPFNTGLDLCLVHNGSLSNHNQLREQLKKEGVRFQTDNDSEVAAGYLTWRLSQGATLNEALEAAMIDLDGFYTFAVGTKDGFAVLRDPIACKPAVIAETDDWVAMSSEYRAIAQLAGNEKARIWEPEPATIYSWERG